MSNMILHDTEGLKAILSGEIERLATQEGGMEVLENVVWLGSWLKRAALDARGEAPGFPPYDVKSGLEQIRDMGYMLEASDKALYAARYELRQCKSELEDAKSEARKLRSLVVRQNPGLRKRDKPIRVKSSGHTSPIRREIETTLPTWML